MVANGWGTQRLGQEKTVRVFRKASWRRRSGRLAWLVKGSLTYTPEPEVTIVRELVDAEAQVDGDVEFTCEVSRDGVAEVEWRLQGLPLQSNEVTEVSVRGGRTHTLRLKGVTPEDAGTVSFHVGVHTSSAQLTVQGSGAGQANCPRLEGPGPLWARHRSLDPCLRGWGAGGEVALGVGDSGMAKI